LIVVETAPATAVCARQARNQPAGDSRSAAHSAR
jgi:hypothetical protein